MAKFWFTDRNFIVRVAAVLIATLYVFSPIIILSIVKPVPDRCGGGIVINDTDSLNTNGSINETKLNNSNENVFNDGNGTLNTTGSIATFNNKRTEFVNVNEKINTTLKGDNLVNGVNNTLNDATVNVSVKNSINNGIFTTTFNVTLPSNLTKRCDFI